jgi:hypothetical protein
VLKAYHGEEPTTPGSLPLVRHGRACLELSNVLKSRRARGQLELLVSWTSQAAAEATWIPVDEFRILYLSYQLADELLLQGGGGGDVMYGIPYRRHKKGTEASANPGA